MEKVNIYKSNLKERGKKKILSYLPVLPYMYVRSVHIRTSQLSKKQFIIIRVGPRYLQRAIGTIVSQEHSTMPRTGTHPEYLKGLGHAMLDNFWEFHQ